MTRVKALVAALGVLTLTAACGFEHSTNVLAPTAPTTNARHDVRRGVDDGRADLERGAGGRCPIPARAPTFSSR